jgi:phosphoribosylformylglycinamidine (FGAM) synthase PurS component
MEEEMKNLRRGVQSPSSAAVSRDLENLGNKLKESLTEIEKYIQRRSTDRELNRNVQKMLNNTYNMYKVEISRIIIE